MSRNSFLWCPLMLISGASALAYEICWIRMFALGLGHEMVATAAVISAFFGGLAIGAWALDRFIGKSKSPVHWYLVLELVIGGWALVTALGIPWLNSRMGLLTGPTPSATRHWAVAFLVPLLSLAPATIAMGGTIPAMDRVVEAIRGKGRWIGGIYAANTLGAVLGTLGTTFWLLPQFGFTRTLIVASALNFVAAAVSYAFLTSLRLPRESSFSPHPPPVVLSVLLFFTGVLGIGYEVICTRVMAQVQENTVYSFAAVLSVYLLGTALGAVAYQRFGVHLDQDRLLLATLGTLSIACMIGTWMLGGSSVIYEMTLYWLGPGLPASVASEAALATLVFAAPTFLMGVAFSLLAQRWRELRGCVGQAIGINTFGAAIASPLIVPTLFPWAGAKWTLIGIGLSYFALMVAYQTTFGTATTQSGIHEAKPRRKRRRQVARRQSRWPTVRTIVVVGISTVAAASADLRFVEPLPGGEVLQYRDGVLGAVAVVSDQRGDRFLKVNNRFRMGGTNNSSNERRLGHIPLLLHPNPKSALLLGLGTGNTLAATVVHDGLKAEAVELVPEVVELQSYFTKSTGDLRSHPNLTMLVSDARRFIGSTHRQYDVIIADLFHPARDGSGSLYTREHFRAVRQRLSTGGLFCQWLPLYQMDERCFRIIVRTFLEVFPDAQAHLSTFDVQHPIVGLIGQVGYDRRQDWNQVEAFQRRVGHGTLRHDLVQSGITDAMHFVALMAANADRLSAFSAGSPINTDDHVRVTYSAPHFIYSRQHPGYVNLLALLDVVDVASETRPARVRSVLRARDLFLRSEVHRVEGDVSAAIDGYLQAVSISADFELAYVMAILQAKQQLREGQRGSATTQLQRLRTIRPERPEAHQLLLQLGRPDQSR